MSGFGSSLSYAADTRYGQRYTGNAAGHCKDLLTGSMTACLNGGQKLYATYYYDYDRRLVQERHTMLNGATRVVKTAYNFSDQPIRTEETLGTAATLRKGYAYDHVGRLTHEVHSWGTDSVQLLYGYDLQDRLVSKVHVHGADSMDIQLQYNIRSWLEEISSPKFKQQLHYNTGSGTPYYNGNISSMTWQAGNETTQRGYKFAYDGLNRLTAATYGEGSTIGTNPNRFTEKVTGYDKQGNIKGLQRYGQTAASTYGLIDHLTMTYDGNRLTRADDAVTASAYNGGFEFKDGVKQANEYTYDENGNLTKDLNKNICNISYNCLNLPSVITFSDGSTINYTYAADGTKLRTAHKIGGTTTTTDYCGSVIYENGVAKRLLTNAGYITLADNQYHYYLQDHQGNNRVVLSQTGTVEEVNHYYPFGGVFASTGNVQPYKYNGKEYDSKKGLNWYDYGARHYDAALERFLTVDPMAEKYYSWSPYTYCFNNPIRYIDPNGQDGIDVIVGYGIGLLTNIIPGTGFLRDRYTPNDANDYNNALRGADNVSMALGAGMTATGGGAMVTGKTATTIGVAVTVGSGGTATPVGVSTVGAGVALTKAGAITAAAGVMLMSNTEQNKNAGYDRGNKSNLTSGNKNSPHANQKAKNVAAQKYQEIKARYEQLYRKPGKTKEDKEELKRLERQAEHWKRKADFSGENHSRNAKGNR